LLSVAHGQQNTVDLTAIVVLRLIGSSAVGKNVEHCVFEQEKNILHNGNISFDDVIEIARIMRDRSCARELKGTVRSLMLSYCLLSRTCVIFSVLISQPLFRTFQVPLWEHEMFHRRVCATLYDVVGFMPISGSALHFLKSFGPKGSACQPSECLLTSLY
jgi:hypothetical protein